MTMKEADEVAKLGEMIVWRNPQGTEKIVYKGIKRLGYSYIDGKRIPFVEVEDVCKRCIMVLAPEQCERISAKG